RWPGAWHDRADDPRPAEHHGRNAVAAGFREALAGDCPTTQTPNRKQGTENMKMKRTLFLSAAMLSVFAILGTLGMTQQPVPAVVPPAVAPPAVQQHFQRGLVKLTPAQKQARAQGAWHKAGLYPPTWSIISPKNSMFLNDTYGDCVLAGEGVNINAHWYLVTGQPVIISDAEIQSYG